MREFDRFGQRKLPHIALQMAILLTLPIRRTDFDISNSVATQMVR